MSGYALESLNDARRIRRPRVVLWIVLLAVAGFFAWSWQAPLDEVAVGEGKIIPSSRNQIIQSLEGGIVSQMLVHEGDVVQKDQVLARLDPVAAEASIGEANAKILDLKARAARLRAEIDRQPEIAFPPEVLPHPDLVDREQAQFEQNQYAIHQTLDDLQSQRELAQRKLDLALPLLKAGATNEVEVLGLRQQVADLTSRYHAAANEYVVALKKDYGQTMRDLEPLEQVARGRAGQLQRTEIRSPSRGIVQAIRISTIGGVIAPGGVLMEITPLDDHLLVETRINPRDIAFIHPGQQATVKLTAYDSSIYGTLDAQVETISPDTITDEVDRRTTYYRVFVRTQKDALQTPDGIHHPIFPGMVATVEIKTGTRTVLSYLIKPFNKAGEALRER